MFVASGSASTRPQWRRARRAIICAGPKTGFGCRASTRCAPGSASSSTDWWADPMASHPQRLLVSKRSWPLAQPFTISRGSKTTADVVIAELHDGDLRGRGECVPYPRYGESVESVFEALEAMKDAVLSGLD